MCRTSGCEYKRVTENRDDKRRKKNLFETNVHKSEKKKCIFIHKIKIGDRCCP